MKQVKSVLAGITAIILICGVVPLLAEFFHVLFLFVQGLRTGGFGVAFGPWRWQPTLNDWLLLLSSFGLGYFWELRRLERREPRASTKLDEPVTS